MSIYRPARSAASYGSVLRQACLSATPVRPLLRPQYKNVPRFQQPRASFATASASSLKAPTIQGDAVFVNSGTTRNAVEVDPLWLRDHCQCSECVHPETKQRQLDTFSVDPSITIRSISKISDDMQIDFSDGHQGIVPTGILEKLGQNGRAAERQGLAKQTLWTKSIKDNPPVIEYEEIMQSDKGVGDWTALIREYGFSYISNVPISPAATQQLTERIAFIRPTHYGGFWDFTSDLSSRDTAYTSLALPAHTDTTYFSDPAGLQLFHLLSHTDGSGGSSLLVDGFRCAQKLRALDPAAYKTLSDVGVYSHASGNEGISIQPYRAFPVLLHDGGANLVQVRWNNSDRLEIDAPAEGVREWYEAARKWDRIVRDVESEYWEQLRPGRPLIFDNWRVLHGRSAFTGKRRLCGAYVNRDDFISRFKMTNLSSPRAEA